MEIDLGSEWQNGPDWLKLPEAEWPIDRSVREEVPEEEIPRIKAMNAVVVEEKESVIPIKKFSTLQRLLTVTKLVFRFIHNLKHRNNKHLKRTEVTEPNVRIPLFSSHKIKK